MNNNHCIYHIILNKVHIYLKVFSFSETTRVTLAISNMDFGISKSTFVRVTLAMCSFIPLSLPKQTNFFILVRQNDVFLQSGRAEKYWSVLIYITCLKGLVISDKIQ